MDELAHDNARRVSVLEEQHRMQTREIAKLEANLEHRIGLMQKDLSDIKENMAKQRGFWAGVTFVASIIGFGLAQLWTHIKGING